MNVSSGTGSPGFPRQIPQSRKTVVCVCVCVWNNARYVNPRVKVKLWLANPWVNLHMQQLALNCNKTVAAKSILFGSTEKLRDNKLCFSKSGELYCKEKKQLWFTSTLGSKFSEHPSQTAVVKRLTDHKHVIQLSQLINYQCLTYLCSDVIDPVLDCITASCH